MTTFVAELAMASVPATTPYEANDSVTVHSMIALGTAALNVGDTLEMAKLPAGCVLDTIRIDTDQVDSNGSATLAFNLGTLTGAPGDAVNARTNNAEFGSQTVGRTAAETTIASARVPRLPPQPVDRGIGLTVTAAAATSVVQGGATATNNRGAWQKNTAYAVNDFVTIPGGAIMACTVAGQSQSGSDAYGNKLWGRPNWNIAKGATTTDGGVTWTCISPVVGMTLRYRPSRNKY